MNSEQLKSMVVAGTHRRKRFVRFGVAFLVVILAAMIGASIRSHRHREPIVDGKPISYWLARIEESPYEDTAAGALRKIGTNAIPWLLSQLESTTPAWQYHLNRLLTKQQIVRFRFEEMAERHRIAVKGFGFLGPSARTAIPALAAIRQRRPEDFYPLQALAYCGSEGLPYVWLSLTNHNSWIASVQAAALLRAVVESGRLTITDAMQFVPALMELQTASNSAVSKRAGRTLKAIEAKAAEQTTNIFRLELD